MGPAPFNRLEGRDFGGEELALDPAIAFSGRDQDRYIACVAKIEDDAGSAFEEALAWEKDGGGAGAVHCAALALVSLGIYGEAAFRLEKLARRSDAGGSDVRAAVLDQAGNAWLLAAEWDNAMTAFSNALTIDPAPSAQTKAVLHYDRARGFAYVGEYTRAIADLDQTLSAVPGNLAALVLRAQSYRALGRIDEAANDIDAAIRQRPDNPAALYERGSIRYERGDVDAARKDWARAALYAEDGPIGDLARQRLQELDILKERPDTSPNLPKLAGLRPRGIEGGSGSFDPAKTAQAETEPSASTLPAFDRPVPRLEPDLRIIAARGKWKRLP